MDAMRIFGIPFQKDRAALYYTMKPRIDLTAVFDTSVWDMELRLLDKLVAGDDTKNRRTLNHVLASYGCAINQARGNIDYQVSTNYWSKRPLTREMVLMVDYAADDVSIVTPRGASANQARYLVDPEVSSVRAPLVLFLSVADARALESDPLIDRIIITRPTVSTSEDLGYLPGNTNHDDFQWEDRNIFAGFHVWRTFDNGKMIITFRVEDDESSAKIRFIELGVHDVQRNPVVQKIV
eukprot:gene33699-43556_t